MTPTPLLDALMQIRELCNARTISPLLRLQQIEQLAGKALDGVRQSGIATK